MTTTLWVAFGGAIGSVARFWIGILTLTISRSLPWGTILINISGSFAISLCAGLTLISGRFPASENVRLFLMVGICGGYTTFSSFSLQNFELIKNGFMLRAIVNMVLSVVLCLLATTLGYYCAGKINHHSLGKVIVEAQIEEDA